MVKKNIYNYFVWINNKRALHRDYDFPACINTDGYMMWMKNNNLHRKNNKHITIDKNGEKNIN